MASAYLIEGLVVPHDAREAGRLFAQACRRAALHCVSREEFDAEIGRARMQFGVSPTLGVTQIDGWYVNERAKQRTAARESLQRALQRRRPQCACAARRPQFKKAKVL
jgi:hypothetical protein